MPEPQAARLEAPGSGTLDVATATFGTDGTYGEVLTTKATLDGQKWPRSTLVDGQGDDVALPVCLADGRNALDAAIGASSPPPITPGAWASSGGRQSGALQISLRAWA